MWAFTFHPIQRDRAVNSTTVNNNGGTILANAGTVQFASTTIQGGTLNPLNGGVLGTAAGNTVTLDGTTQGPLTNAGTYTASLDTSTAGRGGPKASCQVTVTVP